MRDPLLLLVFGSWALALGTVAWFVARSIRRRLRWESSDDARESAYLEQHGLVATARVRAIEPWAVEPVVEVERIAYARSHQTRTHERVGVRLVLELLPLGATQPVVVERTQTVRRAELGRLTPGAFVAVLYDPTQPARFHLDTVGRDQMISAATLRTQQAERQLAASRQWAGFRPG